MPIISFYNGVVRFLESLAIGSRENQRYESVEAQTRELIGRRSHDEDTGPVRRHCRRSLVDVPLRVARPSLYHDRR